MCQGWYGIVLPNRSWTYSISKKRGHDIFLDLKLHDIPNTVSKAMEGLARLDVDLVNVHAAGSVKMMEEAKKV